MTKNDVVCLCWGRPAIAKGRHSYGAAIARPLRVRDRDSS